MINEWRKAANYHLASAKKRRQWASEATDKQNREMFTRWAEESERLAELWTQEAEKEERTHE